YVSRSFFNADVFASRVADGLEHPELAQIVASELADQVIALRHDLIAYRPLIVGSLEHVVRSAPFRALVRRAVRETHQTILSETGRGVALTAGDLGVVVRNALQANPELATKIPPRVLDTLGSTAQWTPGKNITRVLQAGSRMRMRAGILLSLGLVTGVLGLVLAKRKDSYLLRSGILMAVMGFVVGAAAQFGRPAVTFFAGNDFNGQLAAGLWPAFIGPLALRMWIFSAMGIVMVAGVTSTFSRVDLGGLGNLVWRMVGARPRGALRGLLRGAFLAVLGIVVAFNPTIALQIVMVAAAGLLFFFGIQEIFAVTVDWIPRIEEVVSKKKGRAPGFVTTVLVTVLVLVAMGAGVLWLRSQDVAPPVATTVDVCNGHPELCDRRLNEVAFATSHNSMSGGDIAGWMFPNQDRGIPAQLEDGVRGFLVDVHYGFPIGDRVKTILDTEVNAVAKYEAAMGKEAVTAAMRIRDRLVGEPTGEKDVYLAHGFAELGATKFVDVLEEMRDFLVMHPGEVVIMIVQDEGVAPVDVASCFERSGLIEMVYRGPVQKPWPTLREMIDSNQRVVVMAENRVDSIPWYHLCTDVCQETPYGFKTVDEFSNKPNRGGTTGSLLLMNHWIETTPTPLPSNAEIVNAYDFLLKRALACKKQRKMMPNLVAVDFYRTGDLVRVVDALNGVEEPLAAAQ
ncbi:MAG TPA: hypothetical protein VF247_02530, partial [Candidatus Krumholzibacteria bacterium]